MAQPSSRRFCLSHRLLFSLAGRPRRPFLHITRNAADDHSQQDTLPAQQQPGGRHQLHIPHAKAVAAGQKPQQQEQQAHGAHTDQIQKPVPRIRRQLHHAQQEHREVHPVGDLKGAPVDEGHHRHQGKQQRIQHRPQRLGLIQPRRQQPRAAVQRLHHGVLGGDLLPAGPAPAPLRQPACHGQQLVPPQTMAAGHAVRRRFHELLSTGQAEDQHVAEAADAQTQRRPEQQQKTGHGTILLFGEVRGLPRPSG